MGKYEKKVDEEGKPQYEAQREQRIADNKRRLGELGLQQDSTGKPAAKRPKKEKQEKKGKQQRQGGKAEELAR